MIGMKNVLRKERNGCDGEINVCGGKEWWQKK
jgi:hypothetical protein